MLVDRNIDAVVVIMMLTTETGIPSFDFIVDLAKKYPAKPVYVTFMGEHRHNVALEIDATISPTLRLHCGDPVSPWVRYRPLLAMW